MRAPFLFLLLWASVAQAQCFFIPDTTRTLYRSTAYSGFDTKLSARRIDLQSIFGVRVDLRFVEDTAIRQIALLPPADGATQARLVVSTRLLSEWKRDIDDSDPAVAAVLAHGYAHARLRVQGTTLPVEEEELLADYLSGYYLARRDLMFRPLNEFTRYFFASGRSYFSVSDSVVQRRIRAFESGYASRALQTEQAFAMAASFARGLSAGNESALCKACMGLGETEVLRNCPQCKGRPFLSCTACGGEGGLYRWAEKDNRNDKFWFECSACRGKRGTYCTHCSASGTITERKACARCGGSGKKESS